MKPHDPVRRLERIPRQLRALLGAFLVLFGGAIALYSAGERRVALSGAEQRLASEATLLAEHAAATFQEADLALELLHAEVARAGGPATVPPRELLSMARRVGGRFPQIGSLFVVDATGQLLASSAAPDATVRVDVSDRDYFAHHRDDRAGALHLGAPVRNRITGAWRFFLTRRVDDVEGSYGGVVGATIDPKFYERTFRALELPPGKRAVLYRDDGVVLVQAPFDEAVLGRTLTDQVLFLRRLRAAASGAFRGPAEPDRSDRVVGYHRVPGFPAVATVSTPAGAVLAAWWRRMLVQVGSATLVFAVIAGLALGLVRGARRLQESLAERARLEEELIRTARLDSLRLLAGGIAHDLRNLLAGVLANVEVVRESAPPGSPDAEALDDAGVAARRAGALAQQLLAFSREGTPATEAVSLPELIEESARFVLHGSASRVEVRVTPGLVPAEAEPGQLGQVIQNLVLNADQAMPGGGVIRVSARNRKLDRAEATAAGLVEGAYVELAVSDEGPGIAPETAPHVFDPFFTTKPAGHGLGLATVQAIVRRHGGAVGVSSEPGQGATFRVLLPASSREPVAAAAPVVGEALPVGLRVLVVDDEPLLRSGAVRMLARLGCEGQAASDGDEALRRCRAARAAGWRFDAVLADLTIAGGMGGLELVEELRTAEPGVPVILSSGWGEGTHAGGAAGRTLTGWLAKPYSIDQLRAALASALGRRAGA